MTKEYNKSNTDAQIAMGALGFEERVALDLLDFA